MLQGCINLERRSFTSVAMIKIKKTMEKIDVTTLHDNVFTTIGKEWMLVAAGNEEKFNMMTASWGCLGWLWNRPVAIVYIRPERYTTSS